MNISFSQLPFKSDECLVLPRPPSPAEPTVIPTMMASTSCTVIPSVSASVDDQGYSSPPPSDQSYIPATMNKALSSLSNISKKDRAAVGLFTVYKIYLMLHCAK